MAINIRKQFAGVGLASGGGAFAAAPVPSGDLETTRALGGANLRRFNTLARATVAQLKPEALEQFDERSDRARLFADVAGRMRFLPRGEAEALVRDTAPMPDAEDFERQSRLHDAAREAWHEREQALRDDPVAYAADHPSVKSWADNIALQKVLGVRQPLEMSRSEIAAWRLELEDDELLEPTSLLVEEGTESGTIDGPLDATISSAGKSAPL